MAECQQPGKLNTAGAGFVKCNKFQNLKAVHPEGILFLGKSPLAISIQFPTLR